MQITVTDMYGHATPLAAAGEDRVLTVRRQLADGEYDVNGRLGVALDKLVGDLVVESEPEKMAGNAKAAPGNAEQGF